jgi:hypothetical protein
MKKSQIAIGVAAAFGVTAANAVVVNLSLVGTTTYSSNGSSAAIVSGSTATWTYDTVTDILTGTGLYKEQTQIIPSPGQLFTHNIGNLTAGGGGTAGATSYSCIEGSFGGGVGASLCGNYNFGANGTNESSTSWGPGVLFSKTVVGDDVDLGLQQSIAGYDGLSGVWNGTTLVMSNGSNSTQGGLTMTFTNAVPVPAAVWLFGSALGLLGWIRRRTTT